MALKKSKVKFPCGECKRAVRGDSISCDKCSTWYHKDCIHMGDPIFDSYTLNESLEWECTHCALSNISSSIFNSTLSNDTSAESTIKKNKPKFFVYQYVISKAYGTNEQYYPLFYLKMILMC